MRKKKLSTLFEIPKSDIPRRELKTPILPNTKKKKLQIDVSILIRSLVSYSVLSFGIEYNKRKGPNRSSKNIRKLKFIIEG